jgi:ribosome-binding protein aMBF1 (putative translation factor)
MTKVSELRQRWMADKEFQQAYEEADSDYRVVETLIRARERAGLTQADVAKRLHTTQSAIARLESARSAPRITTLRRYARATGSVLVLDLKPMVA